MPQVINYTLSTPSDTNFNVTIDDAPSPVVVDGVTHSAYPIRGIEGTFRGERITGLVGPAGQFAVDPAAENKETTNTIYGNDAPARFGQNQGFDGRGTGFQTASGKHYFLFSGETFQQNPNGTTTPPVRELFATDNIAYIQATTVQSTNYSTIVCFASGTLIRTREGDVAIDDLRVGDLVVTASGEHRPIAWVGHRTIDLRRHPKPQDVSPIRIRAHAFSEGRPARDLLVSPRHAIALDVLGEVLIPAEALVNGATILQEMPEQVTYWHVELDGHDILLAENQPAESYLDLGNRSFFAAGTDGARVTDPFALPDAEMGASLWAGICRPYHAEGALVEAVRSQVALRARALGWTLSEPDTWAEVYLEVGGDVLRPDANGLSASFALPAGSREMWLVCPTSVPSAVGVNTDERALGLALTSIRLEDGLGTVRTIALDDPRLAEGFHGMSPGHRWTMGRARLPAELLEGLAGDVLFRLELAGPPVKRWLAPDAPHALAA